jgi:Cu2+-exporting ATPase
LTIPLAEFGFVLPWLAALGMAASSTLVIANAMRLSTCSFIAIDS